MVKTGRPTVDPKGAILSIRVAERDVAALQGVAQRDGVTVGEAARRTIRKALGVPDLPAKARKPKLNKRSTRSKP